MPPLHGQRWLSVVIPALNEAPALPETLSRVRAVPEALEIIVADGGSTDATRDVAARFGARVVSSPRGRGIQLAAGAEAARGGVILLLHADTWLPAEAGSAVARTLASPGIVGGAFYKVMRDPPWLTRGSRFRCWFRMAALQFAYGDQAIFVGRETLERAGGVPKVPLMEEYLLCAALRRLGRLALADAVVRTSARRFRERGVLRTYWRMGMVNLRWSLGSRPEALRDYYEGPGRG